MQKYKIYVKKNEEKETPKHLKILVSLDFIGVDFRGWTKIKVFIDILIGYFG
jgi:hypothetical protein